MIDSASHALRGLAWPKRRGVHRQPRLARSQELAYPIVQVRGIGKLFSSLLPKHMKL